MCWHLLSFNQKRIQSCHLILSKSIKRIVLLNICSHIIWLWILINNEYYVSTDVASWSLFVAFHNIIEEYILRKNRSNKQSIERLAWMIFFIKNEVRSTTSLLKNPSGPQPNLKQPAIRFIIIVMIINIIVIINKEIPWNMLDNTIHIIWLVTCTTVRITWWYCN